MYLAYCEYIWKFLKFYTPTFLLCNSYTFFKRGFWFVLRPRQEIPLRSGWFCTYSLCLLHLVPSQQDLLFLPNFLLQLSSGFLTLTQTHCQRLANEMNDINNKSCQKTMTLSRWQPSLNIYTPMTFACEEA